MLQKKNFIISETEGKNFSYKSGDFNKIHLDKKYGYNSIFGKTICHGALVIIKFLKFSKLNIKKNSLEINFLKPFFYNKKIKIFKKKKKKFFYYILTQDGQKKCLIDIRNPNNNSDLEFYKNIKYNRFHIFNNNNNNTQINTALSYVSRYVGMIYPGKNSIIKKITIMNNNYNYNNNNKIYISSKSIKNKISIIFNNLKYKNFEIYFETLIRPSIKYDFKSIPKSFLKNINKLKENILVIGASQGIGKDLFKLFLRNKKIIKIGSYSSGSIKNKKRKILIKKITLPNDINLIVEIVKKYQPINIFYFASPKIYFKTDIDQKTKENFNKIFLFSPIEIFKKCQKYNFAFFYPSTEFIRVSKKSPYSKIKLKAEKKLKILGKKYKKTVKIIRFPAINSRQSVSILNSKQQNLIDYLKKNKYAQKAILNLRSTTN